MPLGRERLLQIGTNKMATIYIIKGPNSGMVFELGDAPFLIGRSDSCNVTLDDDRVSGSHIEITFDKAEGRHVAEDAKSTNGTWFNGHSLTKATPLSDGDKIEIGNSVIEYTSKTYESIDAAKAARSDQIDSVAPTLMDDENRPF